MQKCKIHIVQENQTIIDIVTMYSIDNNSFQKMNPLIKNNKIHPGQLLYIPYQETTLEDLNRVRITKQIIKDIRIILYEQFVAASLKQNHQLLLKEYYNQKIQELSIHLWSNEENTQQVFIAHATRMNHLLLEFEQALIIKNEEKILTIKKELSQQIEEDILFFEKNHFILSKDKLTKWVEQQLFLQAKILSKNYYDAYKDSHNF